MCQFFKSSGIVVIWQRPVWRVPHLFGFLSVQCTTGCPASVWYDHRCWKGRGRIISTNMKCALAVETQKQYDLAEGVSAGFDSREWYCRKPLFKYSVVPWELQMRTHTHAHERTDTHTHTLIFFSPEQLNLFSFCSLSSWLCAGQNYVLWQKVRHG